MKRGDATPLEHVARCVQPRDVHWNCRSNVILAHITWLHERLCNVGNFHSFPAQHATVRNTLRCVTRYVTSYVRNGPVTRQLSPKVQRRLLKRSERSPQNPFQTFWDFRFVVGRCCRRALLETQDPVATRVCKDREWKTGSQTAIVAVCSGLLGPFQAMNVCTENKQQQPQDRKTIFETLSLPVAKIFSPVARQAPTKFRFSETSSGLLGGGPFPLRESEALSEMPAEPQQCRRKKSSP